MGQRRATALCALCAHGVLGIREHRIRQARWPGTCYAKS